MRESHGPRILQKIESLLLELQPLLSQYPKTQRYALGEKTETSLLEGIRSIYGATYSKEDRLSCLKFARVELQIVGMFLRIARRRGFLSEGAYENISLNLVEVGKMTSGWIKSTEQSQIMSKVSVKSGTDA